MDHDKGMDACYADTGMNAKHVEGDGARGGRRHKRSAVSTFVRGVRHRRMRARTHRLACKHTPAHETCGSTPGSNTGCRHPATQPAVVVHVSTRRFVPTSQNSYHTPTLSI